MDKGIPHIRTDGQTNNVEALSLTCDSISSRLACVSVSCE